jgi:hypothetical protein
MSSIKNEISAIVISDNIGTNIHQNKYQGNPIENEERKEQVYLSLIQIIK